MTSRIRVAAVCAPALAFTLLAGLPAVTLASAVLEGGASPAPAATPPARVSIAPRVVNAVMMQQLQLFDPGAETLKFRVGDALEGEESETRAPNDAPEYAERALGSLQPPPAIPPTDGPFAPTVVQSFGYVPRLATSFTVRDSGSWYPADCTIGAGPYHLVVAYNSMVAVYTKTGERVFVSSLDGLLGSQAGWKGHFDPKVVYDEGSGRFYLTALSVNLTAREAEWTLAVSMSSDPTQGWYVYGPIRNESNGAGIDYEDLGYGSRAVYLCGNYIGHPEWKGLPMPPGAIPRYSNIAIFDKAAMLAGHTVAWYEFNDITVEGGAVAVMPRVAQMGSTPSGDVDGFVTAWQDISNPANTTRISVWGVTLPANFPASLPVLTRQTVDKPQNGGVPNAVQLGGLGKLQTDNFGSNQLSLIYRAGSLLMPVPASNGSASGVQVVQLSVAWPSVSLSSLLPFSDATNYYLWPNVTMNARGEMALSVYRSGPSEFANARWTVRPFDESGFLPSTLLHAGEGYVGNAVADVNATVYRWGDYSGVAVDPGSQGFWFFGMYAFTRILTNSNWRLWCGFVPRAVYVDPAWAGMQYGTRTRPFTTFSAGLNDTYPGNDLVLKAGTYSAGTPVITRPALIIPDGGTVTITP